nr:PREDICTED: protein jagged-1-like isoform X1 [Lepisosteus oculatus]XP_015196517.1 PREDICTED: protein jagged-1-like isoform X1 [Lepisosteus oculatus]XP_015196518.1 PREDICTED: protein jagged-1-like isoform X1 [Lepisosteus oculatus]XP_015196520.1 PREDICTED: protein jagged-1-like isoform X1 [Lepisosteus oculatus]XP_015196521.1 PREDICTED: protein jagged-1-like isoform X1 [Lepisosteus oculatus]XP_015196522.1 PREDICTED: protein jagged-1-like isoform X1 [Lepisosteus oculatus]
MCPEPGATRAALTGTRRRRGGEAMPDGRVVCVVLLVLQPQVLQAVGVFELQIEQLQNTNGLLLGGGCCDGGGGGGAGGRCPQADQCDTFLRACLKEYQVRVSPTGPCTFGAGSTGVLGGNSFSLRHRTPGEQVGRIGIPFKYAWPERWISSSVLLGVLPSPRLPGQPSQPCPCVPVVPPRSLSSPLASIATPGQNRPGGFRTQHFFFPLAHHTFLLKPQCGHFILLKY